MEYEKMIEKLEKVNKTFYGKDSYGKWQYAKVMDHDCEDSEGCVLLFQDDFPVERTISIHRGFIVSLLKDFEDCQDATDTIEYCEATE
jgi:hypothetical protein